MAIAAVKGGRTIVEAVQQFDVHPAERKARIERHRDLPRGRQATVSGVGGVRVDCSPRVAPAADLALMRRIDALHLECPFAGRPIRLQISVQRGRSEINQVPGPQPHGVANAAPARSRTWLEIRNGFRCISRKARKTEMRWGR